MSSDTALYNYVLAQMQHMAGRLPDADLNSARDTYRAAMWLERRQQRGVMVDTVADWCPGCAGDGCDACDGSGLVDAPLRWETGS